MVSSPLEAAATSQVRDNHTSAGVPREGQELSASADGQAQSGVVASRQVDAVAAASTAAARASQSPAQESPADGAGLQGSGDGDRPTGSRAGQMSCFTGGAEAGENQSKGHLIERDRSVRSTALEEGIRANQAHVDRSMEAVQRRADRIVAWFNEQESKLTRPVLTDEEQERLTESYIHDRRAYRLRRQGRRELAEESEDRAFALRSSIKAS